jgi:hypothetical protein
MKREGRLPCPRRGRVARQEEIHREIGETLERREVRPKEMERRSSPPIEMREDLSPSGGWERGYP